MNPSAVLERARREGEIGDFDLHFAGLMGRLAGAPDEAMQLGAALASRRTAEGHVCVDLRAIAGRPLGDDAQGLAAPPLEAWLDALRRSPVVGLDRDDRPLVLDGAGRLYLARYYRYERALADALTRRAGEVAEVDTARLREGLDRLFPGAPPGDGQRRAAAIAALRHLCVISGGPGTGKTTTVTRILALLAGLRNGPGFRMALAAPTGKAAARLQEVIRGARDSLPVDPAVRDALPTEAATLHRLLGVRPDTLAFRHHAGNPLPVDLLVVDEASMVDLSLMARTVDALPAGARLVLLGDRDQLASVEAGAVLGDICGESAGYSGAFAERLGAVLGEPVPRAAGVTPAIGDCIALLERSHRFTADGGIGALAAAVRAGDAERALALLGAGADADAALIEGEGPLIERALAGFAPYLGAVAEQRDPSAALGAFARFRALCAHRRGRFGAIDLGARIEERVRGAARSGGAGPWYAGRPVMVTRNDHALGLYNGDIGVALDDPASGGGLRVHFESAAGALRRVAPARLPEHETAWAVTVHKSQGSEFDEVLFVLPARDSPLLSRELVYTAVTRARSRVRVAGSASVLAAAIERRLERASGLRDALWSA